jgi:glycosyltransferase involved in cell wall biosynthesis
MPLVSVIIPAYNARQYLGEAIRSVLAQTLTDHELIVIDDGSKDGTGDWVRETFPAVRCITQPNGGVSSARNKGLSLATGEFVAFLDADDTWHPDKLRLQVALMRQYPEALLCRTDIVETPLSDPPPALMGSDGATIPHSLNERFFDSFLTPYFSTSTVMIRRSALADAGGFDTGLKIAEDIDLYLRVLVRAPLTPKLLGPAVFKRPIQGSLGDDGERGYQQLIAVYQRFLNREPRAQALLSSAMQARCFANLWARYAASQRRNGKRREAIASAFTSLRQAPNVLAFKVLALAFIGRA